jgi:hypothetical protein
MNYNKKPVPVLTDRVEQVRQDKQVKDKVRRIKDKDKKVPFEDVVVPFVAVLNLRGQLSSRTNSEEI